MLIKLRQNLFPMIMVEVVSVTKQMAVIRVKSSVSGEVLLCEGTNVPLEEIEIIRMLKYLIFIMGFKSKIAQYNLSSNILIC